MSVLIKTFRSLLTDISSKLEVRLVAPHDLDINWITKSGPALDKLVLMYLERDGHCMPQPDPGTVFPEWLKPLWERFLLKEEPLVLKYIRQILVFGYKARFDPTNEQRKEAQASFVNTEADVASFDQDLMEDSELEKVVFWRTARNLVSRVIGDIDWSVIIPKHGPGSVFPNFRFCERSDFDTIYTSIEPYYPFFDNFVLLPGFIPYGADEQSLEKLKVSNSIVANLTDVPKDSRGPRLISVHPRESIWIQQGQRVILEQKIQKHCSPYISLRDQSVNGSLALKSSQDRRFCTLDLKEASDRLSCRTVSFLFGKAYPWIACSRADSIRLFDGSVMKLSKFAPMGNAICFPVESLCFWAVVKAGITCKHGRDAAKQVFVFGDDILCPSEYYDVACESLTRANLIVNTAKSFHRGFFRESCGVDAFKGVNVTPHRMKVHDVSSKDNLASACALAKNLRMDGYEETATSLYFSIRKRLKELFLRRKGDKGRRWYKGLLSMTNNPECQGICEYVDRGFDYLLANEPSLRWDDLYQRYVTATILPEAQVEFRSCYWYNMQDSMLLIEHRGGDAIVSNDGLSYPIPYRTRLKIGWTEVRR